MTIGWELKMQEIAEELKDLFIQINLSQYLKRQGIQIDLTQLRGLVN